ncbi:GDSL-type esterase/lipase family protein [Flavobacterium sp.]|jgi:hypothetical protein|uniref:GDSL-type esterase/lipase family protein n=1 Tax=Flavobacterium sp. TaxID=239 RepID=UPI0037BE9EE2
MKSINSIYIAFLLVFSSTFYSQQNAHSFIKDEYNFIQFNNSNVLSRFYSNWNSKKRISILHLGDSHLQNENYPNKCRQLFQQIHGDGGIGLIQPFSIVKSYNASFYKSTHTGDWEYSKSYILPPKLALGVRGMSAKTNDEKATFQITFNNFPSNQNTILTIFYSNGIESYEPNIMIDSAATELIYKSGDILKYKLSSNFKNIQFSLNKTNEKQNHFVLYGMSLSNFEDTGAVWHNAGVGACQYKSVLFEDKYEEQAAYLNPDLIIIEYGTNDILYTNSIPEQLKLEIDKVINKVKKANPNASIVLTSTQDMNYKKVNITASKQFSKMIKQIAIENQCGFWDWYMVSGGPNAMNIWQENKLTMNDGVHLNGRGSELKGTLLIEAFKKTYSYLNEQPDVKELLFEELIEIADTTSSKKAQAEFIDMQNKKVIYKVKRGDTLSDISRKFNIDIVALKKRNKIQGNLIFPNQILYIPKQ